MKATTVMQVMQSQSNLESPWFGDAVKQIEMQLNDPEIVRAKIQTYLARTVDETYDFMVFYINGHGTQKDKENLHEFYTAAGWTVDIEHNHIQLSFPTVKELVEMKKA